MDRLLLVASTFCFLLAVVRTALLIRARTFSPGRSNFFAIVAGFLLQTAFLAVRGHALGRCPLTNLFEVFIFMAWSVALIYLVVGPTYRLSLMGAFTAPLVLLIQTFALLGPGDGPRAPKMEVNRWLEFHASMSIVAYGAFALACIAGLMYFLITTIDQTQKVWVRTTEKVVEFQSARSAFESMTRRLSQATLNAYWRAHEGDPTTSKAAFKFRRQSELQFISGPTERFFGASPKLSKLSQAYPTHAVFFQAPIGYTEETTTVGTVQLQTFRNLDSLLATCGYFIEYGVETDRPPFIDKATPAPPDKYRHRLMEMTIPSEHLTIFQRSKVGGGADDAAERGSTDPTSR